MIPFTVTRNLQQKKERSGTGSIDPRAPTKSHPTLAMRQRKLGSHTPPCHRRMVITTLFSVLLAALQRRPVLYHTRWLLTVHRHWSSGHLGQLAPTTHPQCRLVSNPCPAGRDPVMHLLSGS